MLVASNYEAIIRAWRVNAVICSAQAKRSRQYGLVAALQVNECHPSLTNTDRLDRLSAARLLRLNQPIIISTSTIYSHNLDQTGHT